MDGWPGLSALLSCPHDTQGCPTLPPKLALGFSASEEGWDSMTCPCHLYSIDEVSPSPRRYNRAPCRNGCASPLHHLQLLSVTAIPRHSAASWPIPQDAGGGATEVRFHGGWICGDPPRHAKTARAGGPGDARALSHPGERG